MAPMTRKERHDLREYHARLQREYDERDYAVYGDAADAIRKADIIFMGKVAVSAITRTPLWQ